MSETRRKFTREFKVAAVKRLQSGYSASRLARELEVNANQLHMWKRQFEERPNSAFSGEGRRRSEETQVAELERKIGQQAMEIDFFKGCLRQIEELRRPQAETVNPLSAGKSGRNSKGGLR
jgi:transposase-like protein